MSLVSRLVPIACAGLLLAAASAAAKGPDLLVDQIGDAGGGGCTPGACTLREAIVAANAGDGRSIGFDPTVFPRSGGAPIVLVSALPRLLGSKAGVTVDGSGAYVVIDASASSGAAGLTIHSPGSALAKVVLRNLTLIDADGRGVNICGGDLDLGCDAALSKVVVDRVAVIGSAGHGVFIRGDGLSDVQILDSVASDNVESGVYIAGAGDAHKITVKRGAFSGNGQQGIDITASGDLVKARVDGNVVSNNGGAGGWDGIKTNSSDDTLGLVVVDNRAAGNGSRAFNLNASDSHRKGSVAGNVGLGSHGTGINLNAGDGFSKVKVESNTMLRNGFIDDRNGIQLNAGDFGEKTRVSRNRTLGNGWHGLGVNCSPLCKAIKVEGNQSLGNLLSGIRISGWEDGRKLSVLKNRVSGNHGLGIDAEGEGISLVSNVANANDVGIFLDGVSDKTRGTKGQKNVALGNLDSGIIADIGVAAIRFQKNVARLNDAALGGDPDIDDSNPACGTNVWQKNDFGSATDPCVQ